MFKELSEDKEYLLDDEIEAIMKNSTTNNDETAVTAVTATTEKKNAHSFFTPSTLNKAHQQFTTPIHESDDITPFYVLGYN